MTREEAKDVFLNRGFIEVENCRGRIFHADKWREACRVISEWLKQKPCEDAISRKAVVEYIKASEADLWHDSENEMVIEDIQSFPSVTPAHKVGKWIGDKAYPICPKCNCNIIEEYISCSDYAEMYKPMKYCPNCGAEMEIEE